MNDIKYNKILKYHKISRMNDIKANLYLHLKLKSIPNIKKLISYLNPNVRQTIYNSMRGIMNREITGRMIRSNKRILWDSQQ